MISTAIFISLQIEGIHYWPNASEILPQVAFLENPHRHMFHFRLEKLVTHTNRDVEFILFKRNVLEYLISKYSSKHSTYLDFQDMSCEMIAEDLLNEFDCISVEVSEDLENGAIISKSC